MPSQKKRDYVSDLQDKISKAPHFCLIDFDHLSHQGMEQMRRSLREVADDSGTPVTFNVLKNSLARIALQNIGRAGKHISSENAQKIVSDDVLTGPSALLSLGSDWLSGLQAFYKSTGEWEDVVFKIGYIDDKVYEREELEKLAQLPSREVLIGRMLGSFRSPQSRVISSMKQASVKLVYILKTKGQAN